MDPTELSSLQTSFNAALDVYREELRTQGISEPSLATSRPHVTDDFTFVPTPAMFEARRIVLASMGRIKTLIQSPHDALMDNVHMVQEVAALQTAAKAEVASILDGYEDGLPIEDISIKTDVPQAKLERVLRLLVSQGWFREVSSSIFANNRRSNVIKKDQVGYYAAKTLSAILSKESLGMTEMLTHPDREFRLSKDPVHTAFQLSFNTELPFLGPNGWLSQNPEVAKDFAYSMSAIGRTSDAGVISDFPWVEMAAGKDGIIDVGGGSGTLCCSLAMKYPELSSLITQDLSSARIAAGTYIKSHGLEDRVSWEEHDMFTPQKRKGKYLYTIQRVIHDWNATDAAKILSNLKTVLDYDSSILIIDTLIQSGVTAPPEAESTAESLARLQLEDPSRYRAVAPPPFIPADFGDASRIAHLISNALLGLCNAYERTNLEMEQVVGLAGLKIKKIYSTRGWASIVEVVHA